VTLSDYWNFLNRTSEQDSSGFYDEKIKVIVRSGSPGSYTYKFSSTTRDSSLLVVNEVSARYYRSWRKGAFCEEVLENFSIPFSLVNSSVKIGVDPSLKFSHLIFDQGEEGLLARKTSGKGSTGTSFQKTLGTLAAVGIFLTNGEEERDHQYQEDHDLRAGGTAVSDLRIATEHTPEEEVGNNGGSTASEKSVQHIKPSGINKTMNIQRSSGDLIGYVPLEELSEEESLSHGAIAAKGAFAQVSPAEKHVPSTTVRMLQEGIKKEESRAEKKVSFDLPPETEVVSSSSSSPVSQNAAEKLSDPQKKITASYSKELKLMTTAVEIAIDNIPEGAPDRSEQVTAIYAAAYPRIKQHLQKILAAVENATISPNQKTAKLLADTATELMKIAFNGAEREKMIPIKVNGIVDPGIIEQKIPYQEVPVKKVEAYDLESTIVIKTVCNVIEDLHESVEVLQSSDEQKGRALYKSQLGQAEGAYKVAVRKNYFFTKKVAELSGHLKRESSLELDQVSLEKELAYSYSLECFTHCQDLRKASLFDNPNEAKNSAVADILKNAKRAMDVADQLQAMFISRAQSVLKTTL